MELKILTSSITEPVSVADAKSYMGYPSTETTQDVTITNMIKTAREFVEQRTALSLVSKSYKAYFTEDDIEDDWFELPISPVLDDPAITVTMNGVSTTFQQMGMNKVKIKPDAVIGTMLVGQSDSQNYCEVTFQAGASNTTANEIIKRIVSHLFNHREDGLGLSIARLPFDTVSLIQSINENIV